jgi:hypothetical protein
MLLTLMKTSKIEMERFNEAVARIRNEFPSLTMEVTHNHPHVEALAECPVQPGLPFVVSFNLQNCDELHLNVSQFWVEWFPCGNQQVFNQFMEAVTGVLSGRCRIVESYVFGSATSARLQVPIAGGSWKTVARWSSLWALIPWWRSRRVVQNYPNPNV